MSEHDAARQVGLEYFKALRDEINTRYNTRFILETIKVSLFGGLIAAAGVSESGIPIIALPLVLLVFDVAIYHSLHGVFIVAKYIREELEDKLFLKEIDDQFVPWETYQLARRVHVGMEDNGNTPHEHGSFVKRCCVSLRSVNRKFPDTLVHTLTTFIMSFLSCFVVGRYENTVMVLVQIALLVAAVTLSYVRWVHSRGLRVQ